MLADDWNEELSSQMLQIGGRSRLKLWMTACIFLENWMFVEETRDSQGAYVIPWDFYGESKPPTQMF